MLLIAAGVALIWANSPIAPGYHALWHLPVSLGIGSLTVSQSLHFVINDGLMTIFFLVVSMEIRREIHEGALSNLRQASLPIIASLDGVTRCSDERREDGRRWRRRLSAQQFSESTESFSQFGASIGQVGRRRASINSGISDPQP
ncbi:na+/H+ antiporter 1 family protein [Pseudomonas aeruginosa]|uniref:Na+/H+ antiporter NhaA n=1 Tax=Delftia tsuruhatensis TaxID=180282 RepID=UPI0003B1C32B|nr:na+/H+ antiporter 1 family protein [Pseudomonas aeruginosa]ETD42131.1 hypothetical protein X922_27790 [Pseudomonas aeruginosa VRFPA08]ETD77575.1 hypothetical protein V527_22695 [Pseudomonas aeruginosa VRFPA06]OQD22962.1 hypothetical protein UE98_17520 [Burkholderia cenocepacia]AWE77817.1 na+/H+ antiporter 1 family protein [Pseudomonas aeruginosa]